MRTWWKLLTISPERCTYIFHTHWNPLRGSRLRILILSLKQGFPGGPVVQTLPWNAGGVGWIPGQRTKITYAVEQLLSLCTATRESMHHNERSCMMQWRSCMLQVRPSAAKWINLKKIKFKGVALNLFSYHEIYRNHDDICSAHCDKLEGIWKQ